MKLVYQLAAAIMTTPDVPRMEKEVSTQGLSLAKAQPLGANAFGASLGAGIQQTGNTLSAVAEEAKQKADRVATIEGRTKLDQAEVSLLYDPKNGALAKRGKDAFGVDQSTLQQYDTSVTQIEGNLATPEQKQAFRLMADQRRVEINKQLQRHISGELKTYADEANKASLQSTLNNVASNYADPARVEQERKFGLGVIMSDTDNKGLPPEVVKAKVAAWESSVQKSVIEKMVIDNPVGAQEYFDKVSDRLLPEEATKIKAQLKPLAEAQQGLSAANEIFYGATDKTTLADMLKAVHDRFPDKPNVVKNAETELRSLYSARDDARRKQLEDAENAVYSAVAKAKLEGRIPKRSDVPPEAWANLAKVAPDKVDKIASEILSDQEHAADRKRQAEDRADTKRERAETRATLDNMTTWGALKTDPETLRKTNLDALLAKGKLSRTQYQDLITDQVAIRQGKGDKEAQLLSDKAAVDLVLSTVKIDAKKDPERYAKFYDAMSPRMTAFEKENGRRPKQEEVKAMARGLLGEVSQDRSFWPVDKTVKVFEADPAKVRVPAADRATITQLLRSRKIPVTDEAVGRLYLQKQARGGR